MAVLLCPPLNGMLCLLNVVYVITTHNHGRLVLLSGLCKALVSPPQHQVVAMPNISVKNAIDGFSRDRAGTTSIEHR